MNWVWVSIGAIGGLFLLYTKGARRARRKGDKSIDAAQKRISSKERVEQALMSGNVDDMISTLDKTQDPILRNALLGQIITEYYRQRADADAKEAFYRFANLHVEEIPGVLEALEKNGQERPERIETLKMIAIAMEQDGRFDEAIEMCQKALSFGLQNGTKTGFEGRIDRITRRRDESE
jgi:tetratricopeptide (TPR) repeat protein